jgi:hypothetical protein
MDASGEKNILDTPLNELSPELNKKLLLLSGVLKELSTNPATREAVREIAKAVGISLVEIMEEIKPELNKVTDEALVLIDQVAEKSARGATATGVSIAQAILAEIPWVGGVIDFFIALGKGFNALMEVTKTFSEKGGELAVSNAKMVKGTENSINDGIERIQTAVKKAKTTLQDAQKEENKSNITPYIQPTSNFRQEKLIQKGGGKEYIPNRQINRKIQKAGKRLRKTLKLFNKTLPKINYSLKQNNKKKTKKAKKYTHIV